MRTIRIDLTGVSHEDQQTLREYLDGNQWRWIEKTDNKKPGEKL